MQRNDWFYTKLNWRLLQDFHNSSFPYQQKILSESEVQYMTRLAKCTGQIDVEALHQTLKYLNDQMVALVQKQYTGITLLYRV